MSSLDDSEAKIFFYLCFGIVAGIIGFFRGFVLRTKKKLIENIPTSTVRAIAIGLVEVQGTAQKFRETVRTPFSKMESVFYHYKIEEYRSSGKRGNWETLKEFATPDWFYLEDATGKVLINPVSAELFLNKDRTFQLGAFGANADTQAFEQGLMELGISPHGFMNFDKRLRCTETYIAPGDAVYIMGTATNNPLVEMSANGCENLCIQKEGDSFFCISDKSEKELLGDMDGRMYLLLYGGPVLTVACLFFLIAHYFKRYF